MSTKTTGGRPFGKRRLYIFLAAMFVLIFLDLNQSFVSTG